jgi:putative ABC transport system permease protein
MRFYRLLLRLYPSSFRAEYGGEMQADFRLRRERETGLAGRLGLAAGAVCDVVPNAVRAHLDILRQDVRHTARSLARAPGFAVTAVVVAALGIGATTATFSILDHALLRPLPFPEPDRLVRLWQDQSFRGYSQMEVSPPNFRDWQRMSRSFEAIGAGHGVSANLVGHGEPRRLDGEAVTHQLLPLLGTAPALGRLFSAADDAPGAAGTLLLSDALWKTQFGGDPSVLGRSVLLDDEPFTIVGVMPPDFAYPNRETRFWVPARFTEEQYEDRTNNWLKLVARLEPGVSLEAARSEMRGIAAALERAYPRENAKNGATVNPLSQRLSNQSRLLVTALFGAALGVLLIACTNLANLLLVRAIARRKELAVRAALGAGRERLLRQLLTESLILALAGGALGVALAVAATPLLARLLPGTIPLMGVPEVDPRILFFAAGLTTLTGLAFGILPALRACGDARADSLAEGERAGSGRPAERLRGALVVAEVAASVALLVCSGLLVRALWKLQGVDPGFRPEGALTLGTSLPFPKYDTPARRQVFYDRVVSEVRALPGVVDAGFISFLPMTMGGGIWPVGAEGEPPDAVRSRVASLRFATPGYFPALRVQLRSGRLLAETDTIDSPRVAVVSESFAKQNFPGGDPLGRRFTFAFEERTIVGVVGDVRVRGLERTSEPQVYLPYRQMPEDGGLTFFVPKHFVVRASVAPATLLPAVREIVGRADPQIPVSDVRTLSDIVEGDTAPRRFQANALLVFAGAALLLAGIGIHGLLAFTVSQRAREIGVRMALGAEPRDVVGLVVRRGLVLAGAGVLVGVLVAAAAGRAMQALLAGVSPADPAALLAAVAVAVLMTLAGCLAPALRAARLDPVAAMRAE